MEHKLEQITIKHFLTSLEGIQFTAKLWNGEVIQVGKGTPQFEIKINEPISIAHLMRSTSLELGEAYMDRRIEIEGDLFEAMEALMSQLCKFKTTYGLLPKIYQKSSDLVHEKKNIEHHYDLGNDFYKLWLDQTLSYSCAYFKQETDTLYEAQCNKIDYILNKLNLKEGMKLLDIGCGWGELLIRAAKQYKIKGVGITLSKEQYKKFKKEIELQDLSGYLEVKLMDYQSLLETNMSFDRIVSVGMLEHVGREHYERFIKVVNHVLEEKGMMLLHYISANKETKGDAWIKKYIFPGGVIPSLREIVSLLGNYDFHIIDIESLRRHYVKTLLCWYHNFNDHLEQIQSDFDETFIRMWQLYLTSCAASFDQGNIDLHQILFTKGVNNKLPMTRAYLYQENDTHKN